MSESSRLPPGGPEARWRGTVVVRCDVGPTLGVGHLMRCVALAEEFAARGLEVVFVADVASVPFAEQQLAARRMAYVDPPASLQAQLAQLTGLHPVAVVIDSYHLPPELYAGIRAAGPRTLALVDGDPQGREADLYLDQNIGAEDDTWPLAARSERLAGLRYCLIRDDVLGNRPPAPEAHEGADPPRVLAFFGGTDAFGAAPVLTRALLATRRRFDLTVVAARTDVRTDLEGLVPGAGQRITVLGPTDQIAGLAAQADLVLSAAGSSSWELLCLGAAVAFVCVADNQRESYARLVGLDLSGALGALDDLRSDPTPATTELARLLADPAELARMRAAGWQRVDGAGRRRVADALLGIPAGPAVRPAVAGKPEQG